MEQIRITVPGIKKSLRKYDPKKAISEYIWNGFDAGATSVEITWDANDIDWIESLRIGDNGHGIDYHRLQHTFRPFYESEKQFLAVVKKKKLKNSSVHGEKGVGRLTFFTFARHAKWYTVFSNNDGPQEYTIDVNDETLNEYSASKPKPSLHSLGTEVEFTGIQNLTAYDFEKEISTFLINTFANYVAKS
jgi:hypothetical protein